MTQQMYSYGDGIYRFISYSPIKVGEAVFLTNHLLPVIVQEVIESRPDKGDWKVETRSFVNGEEIVKKETIFSNIIKIKNEIVSDNL